MLADEIKTGESANTEFKVEVPKKSEKYIKSVVAFANTAGGKIILGVDDKTHEIVGVEKDEVFKIMDGITNTISDMCYPQIFPNIGVDTIDGKCVIVIEVYPGASRPYYIKSLGKEAGTYIRVSGTSRPADEAILKDLELQGTHRSFDEMICVAYYVERGSYDSDGKDAVDGLINEAERLGVHVARLTATERINIEKEIKCIVDRYNNPWSELYEHRKVVYQKWE